MPLFRAARVRALSFSTALAASGCAIHHVTPYVPDATNSPQTQDAANSSTSCLEAGTPAEIAICADPAAIAANRAMTTALQAQLRDASIFGRDALLANQRAWLLALPDSCSLSREQNEAAAAKPTRQQISCLNAALVARGSTLRAWPAPDRTSWTAIAQYVAMRPSAGAGPQPDPATCSRFATRAGAALARTGRLDPAAMGYQELAGTHARPGAPPASAITVDLYDANVFALFQRRARSVSTGTAAPPIITPVSLTRMVEARTPANQGGRFSSYASQTGDYGSIDVFRDDARTLAVAADAWGSTSPAAPGESAHAGIWDISGGAPVPLCLFDTYVAPAEPGAFDALPNFTPFKAALAEIRDGADLPLGTATRRDQSQLTADTMFTLLHMPLLALQQAGDGARIAWLRHRHDDVLDALFTWSTKAAANKPLFDRAFAGLRPAATDLVRTYQATQGLTATEATQAAGLAIMELLYQSTTTIAPALGANPVTPSTYRPKYPILAAPN